MSGTINVAVVIKLLEMSLIYGVPAVQAVIRDWNKEHITEEDLKEIALRVKRPEEYFK